MTMCWKVGRSLIGPLPDRSEGWNSRGKAPTPRKTHERSQSMDYLVNGGERKNSVRYNLPSVLNTANCNNQLM